MQHSYYSASPVWLEIEIISGGLEATPQASQPEKAESMFPSRFDLADR